MSMIEREVAWRIFASEYNNSTLEISGGSERSPSYVVTPLGAMVNRLYVVGVLTETENMGTPEEPMWRGRVSDPTGTYFINAGQYQPGVATTLASLEPPTFVAVVGKANIYKPDEETVLTSVRAELVKEVNEEQRDLWILEAGRSLKERLGAVEEALKMEEVSIDELVRIGYERKLAEGVKKALEHYRSIDTNRYWERLEDALGFALPEYEDRSELIRTEEDEEEDDDNIEELVLEVLDEMENEEEQTEDGFEYDDILEKVKEKEDITEEEFDEATRSLRKKGHVFEPALGCLKRIY